MGAAPSAWKPIIRGRLLAREEGIFAEPASAAAVAGLLKLAQEGLALEDKNAVCVITGHGLKDPDTAMTVAAETREVSPDLAEVEQALG